jgi:L-malate glycosyltransferase
MITVLVATYNGADTLPAVLHAYCKIASPNGGWELIVVDNGSTDGTKEIVHAFQSRLPLTYVFEPRLGKAVAQNTGLSLIHGDLVVMTDDDALPRPDWLVQLRLAADSQPAYSIFGGAIVPRWEIPPEDWILNWSSYIFGVTHGDTAEGPTIVSRVYGANMAIRSAVLKDGHLFDTSLGPVGSRYRVGEDRDFLQTLSEAGCKVWHCQRAVVEHIILKDQMTRAWALGRAVPKGRADYRRQLTEDPNSPRPVCWLGVPRYMIREILTQAARWARATFTQNADASFRQHWQLYFLVGHAIEARILHCKPPATKKHQLLLSKLS